MSEFIHYAIDASLGLLAVFGLLELAVFLGAAFISPTIDWDEDNNHA